MRANNVTAIISLPQASLPYTVRRPSQHVQQALKASHLSLHDSAAAPFPATARYMCVTMACDAWQHTAPSSKNTA